MSNLKVKSGEPIAAETWNRVVDRLPGLTQGFGVGGLGMSRVECQILNNSGSNKDLGEVLAIDSWSGLAVLGMSPYDIPRAVELTCISPTIASLSKLVVLAEPIPNGERGTAVVSGACVIKTATGVGTNPFLMWSAASGLMVGAKSGIARVLAVLEDDPNIFAIAVLGDSCNLFSYELTEDSLAPETTTAKLLGLDDDVLASEIDLYDPHSLMDDQTIGDSGFCYLAGNRFYALQAPCVVI